MFSPLNSLLRSNSGKSLGILLAGTGLGFGWFTQRDRIAYAEQLQEPVPPAMGTPVAFPVKPSQIPATQTKPARASRRASELNEDSHQDPAPVYSAAWDKNWDKRAPASKESAPKATRHLILIRHGQYHSSEKDSTKQKLTQLGCEQSMATGYRLSTLSTKVDCIYHSDMVRAQETAQIVHKFLPDVPMKQCPLLAEGSPIPPIPYPTMTQEKEERYHIDGPRIEAAFRKHFHRADVTQENDSYEILICHANVIRYFVCRALQVAPEAWLRMSINHCGMTFIDIKPSGSVILRGFSDAGHLDFSQITTR